MLRTHTQAEQAGTQRQIHSRRGKKEKHSEDYREEKNQEGREEASKVHTLYGV